MNNEDLVSVIVPVYNAEKTIERCAKSILNSSYKNIELILVDDGSKDTSPIICDRLATNDRRVKVIHQSNKRAAAARNVGLDNSSGAWISFVDSDDYIDEKFIEELYTKASINNAQIAVSSVQVIPNGVFNYVNTWSFYVKDKLLLTTPEDKIGCIYSCAIWNKLYNKNFLYSNNIRFNENLFLEDVSFNQIATILAPRIVLCREALYLYDCTNQNSFMHTAHNNARILSMLDMTQESKKIVMEKCDSEYIQILDGFEIYNLWGWFKSCSPEFREEFYKKMRDIFKHMNLNKSSSFLLENEIEIYDAVVSHKESWQLLSNQKIWRILFIFKIIFIDGKFFSFNFANIPVIKYTKNKFYIFGLLVFKEQIKNGCGL